MSALFCLFLCFRSYSEKLEEYIPTFYKIRYILEELYAAFIWIISRLIICIDQLNEGSIFLALINYFFSFIFSRLGYFWFTSYFRSSFTERSAIRCWIFLSSQYFPITLPLHEHLMDIKYLSYNTFVFWAIFGHLLSKFSQRVLHTEENNDLYYCYFYLFLCLQYSSVPWIWIDRRSSKKLLWSRWISSTTFFLKAFWVQHR